MSGRIFITRGASSTQISTRTFAILPVIQVVTSLSPHENNAELKSSIICAESTEHQSNTDPVSNSPKSSPTKLKFFTSARDNWRHHYPPTPAKRTGKGDTVLREAMRREAMVSPETSPATTNTLNSPSPAATPSTDLPESEAWPLHKPRTHGLRRLPCSFHTVLSAIPISCDQASQHGRAMRCISTETRWKKRSKYVLLDREEEASKQNGRFLDERCFRVSENRRNSQVHEVLSTYRRSIFFEGILDVFLFVIFFLGQIVRDYLVLSF